MQSPAWTSSCCAGGALQGKDRPGRARGYRDSDRIHLTAPDGYVAFSEGKDSVVVLDLARDVEADVPVVFFDSGLDYPETYDYLTELAQAWRGKNNGAQQIQEVEGGLDRPLSNQPEISESHSPLD
jgi:3'-phosphoadenosine 5'-phosphosulfate sulfotransferase (PAPS reductase)/FAD synthetase